MRHTALAACAALMTLSSAARAQRTTIVPQGMSISATLSPGIKWGEMIFASGQLGTARGQPDSTIEGQTKQALENVKAVVEAGGSTMANVVKCTVFLVDLKDFRGMNSVYSTYWPKDPPARSTVVVAALVSAAAKLEIECIAGIPKG
jgi:2-iminobutanoate/2-iminopropanoate deaminase